MPRAQIFLISLSQVPCAGSRRALTCAGGGRQGYRQDTVLTPERKWRYYGLISYATVGTWW